MAAAGGGDDNKPRIIKYEVVRPRQPFDVPWCDACAAIRGKFDPRREAGYLFASKHCGECINKTCGHCDEEITSVNSSTYARVCRSCYETRGYRPPCTIQ